MKYKRCNTMISNAQKRKIKIVIHYTDSSTAKSAIDYLSTRLNGKGTVGYNCIISKDAVSILASYNEWFHNTGLGTSYDKDTYSIAFVGHGLKDITDEMIEEAISRINFISYSYDITDILCHRELNRDKPDFNKEEWKILSKKLKEQ